MLPDSPIKDEYEYTETFHRVEDQRERYATITVSAFAKWSEENSTLTPACLSVYVALLMRASYADRTCFPSLQTIADDAGVSRRGVTLAVTALRDAGLISIRERKTDKGQSSNVYTILDPRQNLPGGSANNALGVVQIMHSPSAKSAPITNTIEQTSVERIEPPKKKEKRASRIDPDWWPASPSIGAWAKAEGFQEWEWMAEVQQFIDHHTAKGNRMVDWQRAFYTWMRNSRKFQKNGAPPQQIGKPLTLEEIREQVGYVPPPRELRLDD